MWRAEDSHSIRGHAALRAVELTSYRARGRGRRAPRSDGAALSGGAGPFRHSELAAITSSQERFHEQETFKWVGRLFHFEGFLVKLDGVSQTSTRLL